jgi:serine/threonine-protein kinase
MGYLSRGRRTATVTADGPVALLEVNAKLMEQVSTDCQLRFCKVFLKVLIERLARTTEMMVRAGAN